MKADKKVVSYLHFHFSLQFQLTDGVDKLLIFLGVFGAVAHGAATPLQFIIFGKLVDNLIDFQKMTSQNLESMMTELALYYVYLAIGTLLVSYLQMGMFSWS